jgi:predicted nucleotidyltransferase
VGELVSRTKDERRRTNTTGQQVPGTLCAENDKALCQVLMGRVKNNGSAGGLAGRRDKSGAVEARGEMEQVEQKVLNEIIRRIVEVAQPEKIILFGSAVRGEMGPNSDVDLLVVKSGVHRRRLTQAIYMNLFGVGQAVDVVVVTPEDIERYKDSFALVIEPALREGKVVYAQ